MRFYHFTSVAHLEMLVSDGGLKKGHLTRSNGAIRHPVVWLTTDASPDKQGLTTGKATANSDPSPDDGEQDKTRVRIELSIDEADDKLMSFADYCAKNEPPLFARRQGILAAYNLGLLTPKESSALMFTGTSKEQTWWLYWGAIPADKFEGIAFNSNNGFVSYPFAANGKDAFNESGNLGVSDKLIEALRKLAR